MAESHSNSIHVVSTNQHRRQLQLHALVSRLCAPRQSLPPDDICRLIVDGRLQWATEPIDGNTSWLYLPRAARVQKLADCLVLTAD